MRIHDEDCDAPLPQIGDILHELPTVATTARERFLPTTCQSESLAGMWVCLVKMSAVLGQVLRCHYRVNGPKPSVKDIGIYALELQNCMPQEEVDMDDHLLLNKYQLELFYQ